MASHNEPTLKRRLVIDLADPRGRWGIPDWVIAEIRSTLPAEWEAVVVVAPANGQGDGGGGSPEALAVVRGAEVYLGFGVPRDLFVAATTSPAGCLRWAHSGSAGVGASLYPEMRASDVVLTNSAGVYAPAIAETVLAVLFYFARGLDFAVRAQAERRWNKEPFDDPESPVGELGGATLGIVGFGGIGHEVARRAEALGMQVLALRRSGGMPLEELLPRSDYLLLSLPETPETRGMIGAAELAKLPQGAVLVNVGRGSVLDEGALVQALRSGHLRGAGLDVFATEPLPEDSLLWATPGVLVLPHISGASPHFWTRQLDLIRDNLHRYVGGRELRNVVDKTAGY